MMEERRATMRQIVFSYIPLSINCLPADPAINPLFRQAGDEHIQPYYLAAESGRLSEETALQYLAIAYAEGVIVNSPDPGFKDFTVPEWVEWLIMNPEDFAILRSICEVTENFIDEDDADGNTPTTA